MRKVYFSFLTLIFLGLSTASAQLRVEFSGGTASSGSTIDVDVVVRDFNQLPSVQFSINWDPTAFTFNSILNVTDQLSEFSAGSIGTPPTAVVVDEGQLTVSWSHSSTNPFSVPDGTTLFTLRLNASGSPCAGTTLVVSDEPRDIEVVDADFNEIGVTSTGGEVMVDGTNCEGGGGGDDCTDECASSSNFSMIASCESGESDDNICVTVTGRNISNLASITTGVIWDPAVLSYTRTVAKSLPVALNENETDNGRLRVLWSFTENALNLPDNEELFDICFDVIGSRGQASDIEFVDFPNAAPPLFREVTDFTTSANLDACYSKGQIEVTDGDGGGGGGDGCSDTCTDSNDFSIIADCASGRSGETTCVTFTTRNFDNITAFMTGISWNNAVLRYNRIEEKALTGINLNESTAANGQLRLLWQAPASQVVLSLDDGAELFDICFDGIGNPGQGSDIVLGPLADLNFGVEIADGDGNALPFCFSNGEIDLEREQMATPLTLSAGDVSGERGSEACMNITVDGFDDIQSAQFTIQWDADVLEYTELQNIELPEFGNSNANFISPDKLRISWNPLSTASLADGTNLFQACFNVIGACGSSSEINFIDDGNIQIEISNSDNEVLDPVLNSGSIQVNCNGGGGIPDLELTAGNITGTMGEESCLNIRVTDFEDITSAQFTLEWDEDVLSYNEVANVRLSDFNNSDAEFRSPNQLRIRWNSDTPLNLSNNTVLMQVCFDVIGECDSDISSNIVFVNTGGNSLSFGTSEGQTFSPAANAGSIRVGACPELCNIAVSSEITDNTCETTGGIVLTVTGDNGGLRYEWDNNLSNSPSQPSLKGGTYCVTITDRADCEFTRCYTIEEQFFDVEAFVDPASCDAGGRITLEPVTNDPDLRLFYDWDAPLRDEEIEQRNLDPGQYCVTVSERQSRCEKVFCFTVRMDNDLDISEEVTPVTNASGNNGAITLDIETTDDLMYSWSNDATTKDIDGLAPGEYTVTITGVEDCEVVESFTVVWNAIFTDNINAERSGTVSCMGDNDGIISGEITGGCGGNTVFLDGEAVTLPIEGLSPGSYSIRVTDECDNEDEVTIEISEPTQIVASLGSVDCSPAGSTTGVINLDITGGSGSYDLDPSSGIANGTQITDPNTGTLSVLITDSNGCEILEDFEIDDCPDTISGLPCSRARNVISPDGDGVNDQFVIGCLIGGGSSFMPNELGIYDRWGKQVFGSTNYDNSWEGTDESGARLPEGGYMWVLKVDTPDQPVEVFRGTITLLRSDF